MTFCAVEMQLPTTVRFDSKLEMATEVQEAGGLHPEWLQQIFFSFAPSRVLTTSLQLAVFTHIARGNTTVAEISHVTSASQRGIRMLLDALVSLKLITKGEDKYALTPLSAECLVRDQPNYIGELMETNQTWEAWGKLTDVVREGKPLRQIGSQATAEQFFPVLLRSLHVLNLEPARKVARILGVGTSHIGMRLADLACGSGVWGIAIAEADEKARVTAQDFPRVLEITRHYLKRHGVQHRYDFLPGDLKQVELGVEQFDVVFFGNIIHSEGEMAGRTLFKRAYSALKPGGRIAIVDKVPNDERSGPPYPLLFAINMLINTQEGNTFTLSEYTNWLIESGFEHIETHEIGWPSPLIIASRS